ncbi:MAG: ATP-binding protein [Planctomycetes bacterium]|nr:ATP-binding protein [Planctomycetota bacterium]
MSADHEFLQRSFAEFTAAARELESGYAALKARAEAVDHELQCSNRALQQALQERDAVFTALPAGLCVQRDGATVRRNPEAERLCALAAAAGVDLTAAAVGDVVIGSIAVRVQRVPLADGELVLLEDRSQVQQLERAVHRLDRLAGLSELALGIAHEIKNPLNGVMGFAALLVRSDDPATMRRFAGKVVQGVQQVDDIVKALLGFARPERHRGRAGTLAEIAAEAAHAAGLPLARLQLAGARESRADADALVRVLTNLFRNAIEAAPAVRIELHAAVRGDRLELIVQDDGPGVPAEVGARVLEPFVSTKERGTGLGLPLCLRVLAFLGGDLELLNPGQLGARFRIRLPLLESAAGQVTSQAAPVTAAAVQGSA